MNLIKKFNKWYDSQDIVTRFLIFIALMVGAVFPLQIGMETGNFQLALFGLTLFCLLGLIAADRADSLGGIHKTMGMMLKVVLSFSVVLTILSMVL